VFALIRLFALFWAALMVLALIMATINYLRGFPDRDKEPDANQVNFWQNIFQSHAWQNFGIYALAVLFILFILTMISFVLLLLAIERNTRKKD
jgi:4-amino-4-deoxy-L-arabinose transferase-like glycosyltransferase